MVVNLVEKGKKIVIEVGDSSDEDEMELDHFVALSEKSCGSDLFEDDDVMEDESMEESEMGSEKIKKYRRLVSYEERKKALLKVTEESLNSGKCILHKQSCTIVLLFFLDTPTARTISRINPCKSHCWFFPFSIQIIYFIVSGLRKAETGKSK